MSKPQLIVSIDQPILSLNSSDCLILSRKVNKSFSTAFAVGQLTPTLPNDRALLSRNYFTWLDEFQITAWKPHDDGPMVR